MRIYHQEESQTIWHGDNCDVLGTMPRECVDLVVTSPPYDSLREYQGHNVWDFYGVAWQLKRVLKPGGVIVWVVADATVDGSETGTSMEQALHFKRLGLRLHDTMIYQKPSFPFPDHVRCHQVWEYMFVLSNGAPCVFNQILDRKVVTAGKPMGGDYKRNQNGESIMRAGSDKRGLRRELGGRQNVWYIENGGLNSAEDSEAYDHPAIFPESLARDHILSWSNPGDLVCDPFMGSGTTLKMAKETGRRGVGVDICESYCAIARNRLRQEVLFPSPA